MENEVQGTQDVAELLREAPVALNLGLPGFAESLQAQGAEVLHIDWSPPAGGDQSMIDLLEKLL